MEVLNAKVKHSVFGEGTITMFDGKHVTVEFSAKTCTFVYPNAFGTFLKLEDEEKQKAVLSEMAQAKQDKIESQKKIIQENLRTLDKQEKTQKCTKKDIAKGFGKDYNVDHLAREPILTYQQVEDQFGIRITGFGRGINRTDSAVVLISSVVKKKDGFVYHDHWTKDGDYIYSGEGKKGDQSMTAGNKAIVDAAVDGKRIHLFVKFSPQEYYYQGEFQLVDYTLEEECDETGVARKEYKFRLRKNEPTKRH